MTDSNGQDDQNNSGEWAPRSWEPSDWQPTDESAAQPEETASATPASDVPGSSHGDSTADDWSPWSDEASGGFEPGTLQVEGIGESTPPAADNYGPVDDYSPYGEGETPPPADSYTPYEDGSASADPYSAASATDPYAASGTDPYSAASAADPWSADASANPPVSGGYETPGRQPSAPEPQPPAAPPPSHVSSAPYGQQTPAPNPYQQQTPPPADNFPAYQAPTNPPNQYQSPNPYGQQNPYAQSNPYAQQNPYNRMPTPYGGPAMAVNHPRAVPTLVLGIVSMVCCVPAGVVGLVLGITANKEMSTNPGRWTGQGMVTAGIILSAIGTAIGAITYMVQLFG